jgi:uncharacterized protein (TIGR02145 family)
MKKIQSNCLLLLICMAMFFNACKKDNEETNDPPLPEPKPTFTDSRDGQIYVIIEIGNQTWMAENLRAIKFPDNTLIPEVEGDTAWYEMSYLNKAYCWHENDSDANALLYGALYNWAAAMDGDTGSSTNPSGIQGICPKGWHLPSDSEWKQLEMNLGMSQADADNIGFRGNNEGGKMKESGTTHWKAPNTAATNESGFTALPAGSRNEYGSFDPLGFNVFYWSTTRDNNAAWVRGLNNNYAGIYRYGGSKSGCSVRCVKN